ncbi:MAG: MFS transporter, partial [Propionibacteriales bacterium]|nr:MFS transporter [Propionibacteriales bacterium]
MTTASASARLRDDPDFRRFLAARLISLAGTSVTLVALPVVVYSLSRSPLLTALVAAFEAVPYLLFGLPAGALADRFNRKRLMVAADLVNAVVLASVPVASWFGVLTVPHVLGAAFVVPALFVFFDAADFGAVPTLVGRDRVATANSAIWSTGTVIETSVPLAAGAAFAVVAPASLIAIDALSYVASALLIRTMVRPLSDPDRHAARLTFDALVADVREGLGFLWGHATVRSMTIVGAAQAVAGGAFVGQMVVWADRALDVRAGDWRLGVVFSAWGVGVFATSVLIPQAVRRVGAARVTLLALPASAVLCVLTALASHWVVGSLLMIVWGAAYMAVVINAITYRQQVTPEPLMSRVNT